jgi:formate hydrogenlyase subunit 3/multisubunit Na+/H+ antiporter MnhD subunit
VSAEVLLIAAAAGIPLLLAALWPSRAMRSAVVALAPLAALPALMLTAWPAPGAELVLPQVFTGVRLGLDPVGRAFLFFTAALWTGAGIFARSYHADDPRRDAFFGFFLLTLSGNLILVLARDLLTFYLGFAAMTFAAYGLVVHNRAPAGFRAGRIYLVLALAGEACLLAGLMLAAAYADGLGFDRLGEAYAAGEMPAILPYLFVLGFGVKAGLVPLHMWLPLAHPVAPTAASALLSGVMVKAGLLGWIRFLPFGSEPLPGLGTALIAAGVLGAFYGVVLGSLQREPKTVLAYSTVSQIGYMTVACGIALLSPAYAAIAVLALVHYAAHHAFAKAALFLSVGVAPRRSHPRMRRVWLYAGAGLPALVLAGAPFTSGAAAKAALKYAGEALPGGWPSLLALLLSIAAAGTTLLLARFLAVLGDEGPEAGAGASGGSHASGNERDPAPSPPPGRWIPWAGLVVLVLLAPLWLTWAYPAPPGVVEPTPVLGLFDSLWPLGVGGLLALGLWRFQHQLPFARVHVPPGDLIVPLGRLAAHRHALPVAVARARAGTRLDEASRRLLGDITRTAAAATLMDRRLTAGGTLGTLILAILAALGLAFLA